VRKLKKFLDSEIGEHGYIEIQRNDGAFLCEGKVGELRAVPLWELLDEDNAKIKMSILSVSQSGKRCIKIVLS